MKNKLISILITNFNKEKFLKNCLNSLYRQNLKNFEIILFDDCSSDNSLKIIRKYKKVKLILNKKKISEYAAINQLNGLYQAFKKSNGKIICLLDGDDYFSPNKLKEINDFFIKNKKSLSVYNKPKLLNNRFILKNKKDIRFIWPSIFPTSCISVRRSLMKKFFEHSNKNKFYNLEIDARIVIFSHFFLNEYNVLNRELTTYNYDVNGITSNINKFSKKWWLRRSDAFDYLKIILEKKNIKFEKSIDYIITKLFNFIIKKV